MKTLTKVKLINWYSFINQEFPVYKNALITGENGSGKSTVLDAIQYVLTVGTCKFNKAASDIGDRTLETYIRCKTGEEGKEFIRNGDVTSYIALEFYDEKTKSYQIIGAAMDLPSGSKVIRDFFQIVNVSLDQVVFIEERKVLTRKEFKNKLNENEQRGHFKDTIKDGKQLFSNALGVKKKYFDLVTRALAFKAIENVYQFIMDFLLKEDFIDINNLRQSIQHYQRISEQLKRSQEEYDALEEIIIQSDECDDLFNAIEILNLVKIKIREKYLYHSIFTLQEEMKKIESNLLYKKAQLTQLEQQNEKDKKHLFELENSLQTNKPYQLKATTQQKVNELEGELEKKKNDYETLIKEIKEESNLFKKLAVQKDYIKYVSNGKYTTEDLSSYIHELIQYVNEENRSLTNSIDELNVNIKVNTDLYNEKNEIYKLLNKSQITYKKEVQSLIELLKDKLFNHYGKRIEVKPLCEYLEVKDESWRNAVEGYLNTQRFDIIIEPEYFEYSLLVYEEYKNKKGIFGVGIVDVAKLKKFNDTDMSGTLSEKISTKNIYAQWYINMLLRYVICVDEVNELRKHKTAITKTVMLYKNYTVKALNPRIYKNPVIGLGAIEIQKVKIKKELEKLTLAISKDKNYKQELENKLSLIKESKAKNISYRLQYIDEYQAINDELNSFKERLSRIKLDDTVISLSLEVDGMKENVKSNKEKLDKLNEKKFEMESKIRELKEDLERSEIEINEIRESILKNEMNHIEAIEKSDEMVINYEKQFSRNFKKIDEELDKNKEQWNRKINNIESKIILDMRNYNNNFNVGFENSVDAMDDYKKKYQYLKDIDLVDKIDKARQAKIKSEETFKTSFVSGLNEKIENARKDLIILNKNLSKRDFNGEIYEFCISPTSQKDFKEYYEIIQTGKEYISDNLLSETLSEGQRKIMDELFERLSNTDNDKDTEKLLIKYTDYRNYLDYDIKITKSNGAISYFSKTNRGKSGGETQTPFYVIMAASFEQIITDRNSSEDFGCVVLFDEAFNNMDEPRIKEMIKFYNEREIQTFIAVPAPRASTIIPHVNTRLLAIKYNDQSFIEVITDEKL